MITPSYFVCPLSGSLTIVVIQHSASPLAALNRSTVHGTRLCRYDQAIPQPLVVPLVVIVHYEFVEGLSQRAFFEQDHPLQAGFLDGPDEVLGVGIVVCQQLQAVRTNPLVDAASPTRFILW
jgi:hypothetical protein